MKYTTINEFKKYLEQSYHDPIEKEDNVQQTELRAKNQKYEVIFFDYPEFALLKDKDGKYYVYSYSFNDESIYSDFVDREIIGRDEDGVNTTEISIGESTYSDDIIENYINYRDLDLTKFVDEFDEPDALYLMDEAVFNEFYEFYKDIPLFREQLDQIKGQVLNESVSKPKPHAIFQEEKDGKLTGNKIYYYKTEDPKWWAMSVGKELKTIPEYQKGAGQWMSRKQYKTIGDLVKFHKPDNIIRIDNI